MAAITLDTPIAKKIPNRSLVIHDNLPVLAAMPDACVDLIYLDPPFNSKRQYSNVLNIPAEYAESLYQDRHSMGDTTVTVGFSDTWSMDTLVPADPANAPSLGSRRRRNAAATVELKPNPNWKPVWLTAVAIAYPELHAVLTSAGQAQDSQLQGYLTFMSVRLLEMRRILKDTGSIYLHCDPTAGHYLKAVMDCIFGKENFRNEVVWKRHSGRSDAKRFGRVHDTLLFYSASSRYTWNRQYLPHDPDYVRRNYKNEDSLGIWSPADLTATGRSGGDSGEPWRGVDPGKFDNHWRTPIIGGMNDFIIKHSLIEGWPQAFPTVRERLDALDAAGLIYWPEKGSMPRLKRYLDSTQGKAVEDIFTDIPPVQYNSRENTEFPTQKPLALLERVIRASSNAGDVVLDPFCGCATSCVAAEKLGRRWIGIDVGQEAYNQVIQRMRETMQLGSPELPLLLEAQEHIAHFGADFPGISPDYRIAPRQARGSGRGQRAAEPGRREPIPDPIKRELYGIQEGRCAGCGHPLPYHILTNDHITPRARGGTEEIGNLQLLCGSCNPKKGDSRTTQALWEINIAEGILIDPTWVKALWQRRFGRPA